MTAPDSPATLLASLDDEAFRRVVTDHLGTREDDETAWVHLLDPRVVQRTQDVLTALRRDMDGQLGIHRQALLTYQDECLDRGVAGKADFRAYRREQGDWRRRALGFKLLIERRQVAVNDRIRALGIDGADMTNRRGLRHQRNLDALYDLALAVAEHKRLLDEPDRNEPEDEALWDCLDSLIVVTRAGDLTLAEWAERAALARQEKAS